LGGLLDATWEINGLVGETIVFFVGDTILCSVIILGFMMILVLMSFFSFSFLLSFPTHDKGGKDGGEIRFQILYPPNQETDWTGRSVGQLSQTQRKWCLWR
jgi:hypothetical protein